MLLYRGKDAVLSASKGSRELFCPDAARLEGLWYARYSISRGSTAARLPVQRSITRDLLGSV